MPDLPNGGGHTAVPTPVRGGRLLTIGLGTILAVWTVMYITAMPVGNLTAMARVVIGALLVGLSLLGGGIVGGRKAGFGAREGVGLGLFITVVSLLVLLSLVGRPSGEVAASAVWWIGGFLIASCALGAIGAMIGRRGVDAVDPAQRNWTHALAMMTVIATGLMIVSGGIVTGFEAGLAIEGWLTADGHVLVLFPVEIMTGDTGKFAEHAHRLWGLLVGLSSILLAIHLWRADDRTWVRRLGVILVLAVIAQGVMGGLRVTEISTALAIVHGIFAQGVFSLIAVIAACTTTSWRGADGLPPAETGRKDRRFAIGLPSIVLIQVTIGAIYRHQNDAQHWTMHVHLLFAMFVLVKAIMVGGRMWSRHDDRPGLPTAGKWVLIAVGVQLLFGLAALIAVWSTADHEAVSAVEVAVTTIHQATGALIMALSVVLVAWAWRVLPGTAMDNDARDAGGPV